ncbi:tripartite motif-containing protein 65-like isoform X2 [Chelmon rostratus]|uniref:tripartite motif-containing protein 65-like isoform X2 n=1 Tax=Chelmon rostratus TaxID=109905 RepID=UPI001BE874CE|nr:tripartite motif-containing protein 65-like isoform X2 [Chelmon rostratus]
MSLAEEPPEDNDQKEPEICLQEDNTMNESNPEDQKDKRMKDVMTSQRDKRTMSPLSLLKEDFSQFKEEVTSVFSISSSKDKDTKSTEKTINRLSSLKEDFNHLKEDLSNVFRIGLSKERDSVKEDSSNTFKIKVLRAERTDEPFKSLFKRDQKTSQKAGNRQDVKKAFLETSEEQMDDGFRGILSEQKEETVHMKGGMDDLEDGDVDITASEEKTESLSETQQSEEMIPASQAEQRSEGEEWSDDSSVVSAEDKRINQEEEEENKTPETRPCEPLSSGISLLTLRHSNKDDMRDQPGGDLWSVRNFACYLTFDPNTANSELQLTHCNRNVTRVWSYRQPPDHPDRFEHCPQVLCREGLLDSAYWEVLWSGGADIGVTYNSISRHGDTASCLLGHNDWSWSLECSEGSYTPCHDNKRLRSCSPRPFAHRVGVYLDWSAGSLSFYCVSQDSMVHLHTFTSTFTEPLYPGFWVWAYEGSVSLCHVTLDWERLLQ